MDDDPSIRTVAMPLVATGDQHIPAGRMIDPLLDAAVHWIALGLPLTELKVVAHSNGMARDLAREFADLKTPWTQFSLPPSEPSYDVFVSYSHKDASDAAVMVEELQRLNPGVRVFFDRLTLTPALLGSRTSTRGSTPAGASSPCSLRTTWTRRSAWRSSTSLCTGAATPATRSCSRSTSTRRSSRPTCARWSTTRTAGKATRAGCRAACQKLLS